MLTLYHAPNSRSTRIVQALIELDALASVDLRTVTIPRFDGSGARDPANPHPEGKVPLLVHDGVQVRESAAILQYLTELFPEAGLAPAIGDPQRGAFLAWLDYYGNVVEPLIEMEILGLSHPGLTAAYRDLDTMGDRLAEALRNRAFLLGDNFSAADLLLASPFGWMPRLTPDRPEVKAWVARCQARPSAAKVAEVEQAA